MMARVVKVALSCMCVARLEDLPERRAVSQSNDATMHGGLSVGQRPAERIERYKA